MNRHIALRTAIFALVALAATPVPLAAGQTVAPQNVPTLRLNTPIFVAVPSASTVTVSGRNGRGIRLQIFAVPPVALLRALRHPYGADRHDFLGLHPSDDAGNLRTDLLALVASRTPLAEIAVPTPPDTTGAFVQTVPLPVQKSGAYILVAHDAGNAPPTVGLCFRTDLKITRRAAAKKRGGFVYTVTDARTKRPVPGVRVFTRDGYAARWGFVLDANRGELPQPQPLDSLPAPTLRYTDAFGTTDKRGQWRNPRAPFAGQGAKTSLDAGTPMATGGLRYDFSQTIAFAGARFGVIETDYWGASPRDR